jgi:hypothetical protein
MGRSTYPVLLTSARLGHRRIDIMKLPRFGGRRAPEHKDTEEISVGFWPGSGTVAARTLRDRPPVT